MQNPTDAQHRDRMTPFPSAGVAAAFGRIVGLAAFHALITSDDVYYAERGPWTALSKIVDASERLSPTVQARLKTLISTLPSPPASCEGPSRISVAPVLYHDAYDDAYGDQWAAEISRFMLSSLTAAEWARGHGKSARQARSLLIDARVPGARFLDNMHRVPADAPWPPKERPGRIPTSQET